MNNLPIDNNRPVDSTDLVAGRAAAPLAAPSWRVSLGRPHEAPRSVTPRFALNVLGRWWKLALPIGLLLAGLAGGVVWTLFEPKYEASAWLRIRDVPPKLAFALDEERGYSRRFVETQIELLRSPKVLKQVVEVVGRIPEVARQEDQVRWLQKRLVVTPVGRSELYTVSIPMSNPQDSADVANAVVETYFKVQQSDEGGQLQGTIDLLEKERAVWEKAVGALRESVRNLAATALAEGVYVPKADAESAGPHPLGDLQSKLAEVIVNRRVMQANVDTLADARQKQPASVPEHELERAVEQNPIVQELRGRLFVEKQQVVTTQRVFQKEGTLDPAAKGEKGKTNVIQGQAATGQVSPIEQKELQRLRDRIAEDEKTLEQVRAAIRKEMEGELKREYGAKGIDELQSRRAQLAELVEREKWLQNQFNEQLKKAKGGSRETLNLEFERSRLKLAQQVLDLITMRVTELKTEQFAPSGVSKLWPAESPSGPVERVPYSKLAVACLGAFWVPFLLAFGWERMVRRVSEPADLEHESQLTVIGEVARLSARKRSSRGSASARVSVDVHLFEESIDSLRTNLLLPEHLKDMKTFAVTSASSHEGKTSVAVSLAVSLARASGQAALLIDGDMRSPDIHELFDTRLEPGLVDVLKGESTLDDAIITSCSSSVHLLPAGTLLTSPHTLLGNGAFRALLREAASKYRYCVIDTPPVLSAAEALVMAKVADACLICAMRNVSRGDHVRKACERLLASGSRPVGAVLNGVPRSRYEYRRAKYYYSHP